MVCLWSKNIIIQSQKTKHKIPLTEKPLRKIISKKILEIIEENKKLKILVFVGMTAEIPTADYVFYIKIKNLGEIYRRFVIRELDKIIDKAKIVKKIIEIEDPQAMKYVIDMNLKLGASFPLSFKNYKEYYMKSKADATKNKFIIKSQDEIIASILKISGKT